MRLTINFKDDILDSLDSAAERAKKPLERFIADALPLLCQLDQTEKFIILNAKQIGSIQADLDGKTIQTADELVRAVKECFRVALQGGELVLDVDDLQQLKAQYDGMGSSDWQTFEEYVKEFIADAISLHLNGSVKPRIAYK
jgi:hypothetical protein